MLRMTFAQRRAMAEQRAIWDAKRYEPHRFAGGGRGQRYRSGDCSDCGLGFYQGWHT